MMQLQLSQGSEINMFADNIATTDYDLLQRDIYKLSILLYIEHTSAIF